MFLCNSTLPIAEFQSSLDLHYASTKKLMLRRRALNVVTFSIEVDMIKYVIKCSANPCWPGSQMPAYQYSNLQWYSDLRAEPGFEINDAYKRLSAITSSHPKCECKFEVVELGAS